MFWPQFATFTNQKKDLLEDNVDRLSTWIAASVMLVFCSVAGIGFYNGSHMECMIPAEYPDSWKLFFSSYCYVQSHVFVYTSPTEQLLRSEIAYFPWIPFFFFLHACVFYFPKLFWKGLSLTCGFDLEGILIQAQDVYDRPIEVRKEKIKELASIMTENLRFTCNGSSPRRFFLSLTPLLFLFKKWLIVAFSIFQFNVICDYVGNGNSFWGFEVLMDDSMKTMLAVNHSPLFPIHSWCRVPVVQNNDVHDEIALCVLGMNVIFEKLYVFTYFMLLFIIPVSTISAGYYTFLLIFAYFRSSTVADLMGFKKSKIPFNQVKIFTHDILGSNGVLAITLIKNNFGNSMIEDLLKEIWAHNEAMRPSNRNEKKDDDFLSLPPPPKFLRNKSLNQSEFSLPPHYTTLPLNS